MFTFLVFDQLAKGKGPQWMIRTDLPHSFTYTPDAGKFTALLGNTPAAYGQSWHLPTAQPPWTPADFIRTIQLAVGNTKKTMVLGNGMMRFLGLFLPILRETQEMQYQNSQPYFFDSSKFERHFKVEATPYAQGLAESISYYLTK
jgi:nucleoside-diphosphate-sugar epimerase